MNGTRSGRRTRGRRLLVVLLASTLLLVAVFYLGGGWYFSGQIHADGLKVENGPQEMTLRVVDARRESSECSGGPRTDDREARIDGACWSVTLRELDAELPALRDPILYGLAWGSGYGQLDAEPVVDGDGEVRRRVVVTNGAPPRPGDEARLDRSYFASPSLALDRPVRTVRYSSPAGRFPAWYVAGQGDTWAILVHGYRSSRSEVLRAMAVTVDMGLPSLAISYRNDNGVPQDPDGHYRFGETEWEDLEGAVQYAMDHGATKIALIGNSMGGAVTASFLARSRLAGRVSAVVLDSPMLDFGATVSHGAAQQSLPLVNEVPGSLVSVAKMLATARYGVDWDAIDYLEDTSWVTAPTLVLHGTEDLRVPFATSQELAEAEPELVRLRTFHGAEHVGAWNQQPKVFDRAVREFLR